MDPQKQNKVFAAIRKLQQEVEALKLGSAGDLTQREAIIYRSDKVIPYTNVMEITVTASTARVTQSLTISQEGWFFLDRLYVCYRPTTGAQNGRWRPVSSGNPSIASGELQAGSNVVGLFNFSYEYAEGRAQRTRQNIAVPGDILYRSDGDGYIAPGLGDGIGPNSTITFHVTPTIAPVAGVCVVAFVGVQCLGVLKQ